MLREVLQALMPRPGGRYVDGTVGGAGHALAILDASSPTGWLFGCDRDGAAIEAAQRRLAPRRGRYELRQASFAELTEWIEPDSCHGLLLDLGVSSPQLDGPERGFSFQHEGPLDMRMDRRGGRTAAELVNELSEGELAKLFWELADEPQSRRMARAIVRERQQRRIETTGQLARCIERCVPRRGAKKHPATRVFQAVRMAVNDEVNSLKSGLAAASSVLTRAGRLAVITFQSGEDRIVKAFGQEQTRDYTVPGAVDVPELRKPAAPRMAWIHRKAIQPGAEEVAANPRARSARLRVLEKL